MPGAFFIGDWRVDPSLHSISGASGEVRLEPKVMQVLVELAEHPGQVVSKDRLLQTVWADTLSATRSSRVRFPSSAGCWGMTQRHRGLSRRSPREVIG
jgi:DNA-binding winged helix-turn-helix (wHTH) protein